MMSFRAALIRPIVHYSRSYHIKHIDTNFENEIQKTATAILKLRHRDNVLTAISFIPSHSSVALVNRKKEFLLWKGTFTARVMTYMLDLMKVDRRFDPIEVFRVGTAVNLDSSFSNGTEMYTKEEVCKLVQKFAETYPLNSSKVMTYEARWAQDLGMSLNDRRLLVHCLQIVFKMIIPTNVSININSVKSATGYIYGHLGTRFTQAMFVSKYYDP